MTDQTKTKELSDQPKPITLRFSFPDVITVGIYQKYTSARLKYVEAAGGQVFTDLAQYEGARALVNAGIVHITSDEEIIGVAGEPTPKSLAEQVKAVIAEADQSNTPISIMRLVGGVIATKIEAEAINPTLLGKSFFITTTR